MPKFNFRTYYITLRHLFTFRQPLLVFDGESFWHVLHGSLPRIFGGQFIQFRKKAEDVCKRLTAMGYRLSFIFGNSPISADAKVRAMFKQKIAVTLFDEVLVLLLVKY